VLARAGRREYPDSVDASSARLPRFVLAVVVGLCAGVLVATERASAERSRAGAIDPGTVVNGMLVVHGVSRKADGDLFTQFCDPVVLRPGRRTRTCAPIPHVSRLFVGHGVFAPERMIDGVWSRLTWDMWVDGQRVDLVEFGTTDRWLRNFAPADGRTVVLREWSITLVRPSGRHSIRYRTRWPSGVFDTTWTFVVAKT
jgi:hypothetical protein